MNENIVEQVDWLPKPITFTTNVMDKNHLYSAYRHAMLTSLDPKTKNGAILTDENRSVLIYASNRFAPGIAETSTRLNNRCLKYKFVVHAEQGVILNAARHGKSTKNTILYCPFYSCSECAKAIIQAGIKRVVGHAQLMAIARYHEQWVNDIIFGWEMFQEAGVECWLVDAKLKTKVRFNGNDIDI